MGCTVEPAGYEALTAVLAGGAPGPDGSSAPDGEGTDPVEIAREEGVTGPGLVPALGLHPWYLGEGDAAEGRVTRFCDLAPRLRLIGEIGLDRGKAHCSTFDAQRGAFEQICGAVSPGSVLSIHSVGAAEEVLAVLAATGRLDDCVCVLHWFSGTSDEFVRARKAGCYFSVGPFMLRTRKGRECARQVPLDRLLLETDLPERPGTPWDAAVQFEALGGALATVAELKGIDPGALSSRVAATSRALLS